MIFGGIIMTKITLTQYIKDIAQDHNIETTSNHFKRFRRAFTKQLQRNDVWQHAHFDENNAKSFDVEDLDKVYCEIEDKVQDIIKDYIHECDTKEFWEMYKEAKSREEDLKEMEKYRRKYEVRYATDEMEKDLMLKAIYSMFFHDIDREQWNKDLETLNKLERERYRAEFYEQEFRDMTVEESSAKFRIQNPVYNYCKRRK